MLFWCKLPGGSPALGFLVGCWLGVSVNPSRAVRSGTCAWGWSRAIHDGMESSAPAAC